MIWPATHLLCHYLASQNNVGDCVLELGCGVGVVGLVSTKANSHKLWVSTDGDESALEMCRKNFVLNEIPSRNVRVRKLQWGNEEQTSQLLDDLKMVSDEATSPFDSIVAADIVYPDTCGPVLKALFTTVDRLLKTGGIFWLSFVTRDGARTPRQLIESASDAGFRIQALPQLDAETKSKLPPLLDARILFLTREAEAREKNAKLGCDDCSVFPGLRAAMARLDDPSSEEEWEAPFGGDESSDEE
jgi:ribosomal protein L11 methylase PrmA